MIETYPKPKREAILRVFPDLLVALCKAGPARTHRVALNALPADARFERAAFDDYTGAVLLVVSSDSFADATVNHRPELPATMFRVEYHDALVRRARAAATRIEALYGRVGGGAPDDDVAVLLAQLADALDPPATVAVAPDGTELTERVDLPIRHADHCNVWQGCQQCDGPDLTRKCTCELFR
jgi:hypothetical protein